MEHYPTKPIFSPSNLSTTQILPAMYLVYMCALLRFMQHFITCVNSTGSWIILQVTIQRLFSHGTCANYQKQMGQLWYCILSLSLYLCRFSILIGTFESLWTWSLGLSRCLPGAVNVDIEFHCQNDSQTGTEGVVCSRFNCNRTFAPVFNFADLPQC
jgi:hypothetical protein